MPIATNDGDSHAARQLGLITLAWLLLIFGAGLAMILLIP